MRRFCAVSVLLAGCIISQLPAGLRPVSAYVQAETLAAWAAEGYPPGDCAERELAVRIVPEADRPCRAPGRAGCYMRRQCEGLFDLGGCVDVIVEEAQYAGPELTRHEMTHWLLDCSGLRPNGDVYHSHALWATDGFTGAWWPDYTETGDL